MYFQHKKKCTIFTNEVICLSHRIDYPQALNGHVQSSEQGMPLRLILAVMDSKQQRQDHKLLELFEVLVTIHTWL